MLYAVLAYNGFNRRTEEDDLRLKFGGVGRELEELSQQVEPERMVIVGHSLAAVHALDVKKKPSATDLILVNPGLYEPGVITDALFQLACQASMKRGDRVEKSGFVELVCRNLGLSDTRGKTASLVNQVGIKSLMLGLRDVVQQSRVARKDPQLPKEEMLIIVGSNDQVFERWCSTDFLKSATVKEVNDDYTLTAKRPATVLRKVEKYVNRGK